MVIEDSVDQGALLSRGSPDQSLRIMMASSIALRKQLGMETVAERVEFYGDLALLRTLGCDTARGYFFSRPEPAERIPDTCNSFASA